MRFALIVTLLTSLFSVAPTSRAADADERIQVLFLGDQGHHRPAERYRQIAPVLQERGIDLEYTESLADLNAKKLAQFDALLIYANHEKIAPEQEQALLDYVASGHGFVPVHCASYCFLNSPAYVDLVGAQFQRHGTGTFRTRIVEPQHPIMQGFDGFQSWDETYTHTKHNEKNRTVLEIRADSSGFEPWTWVRTQGKGRVFYTAWGHDERTFGEPGFQILLERGIRWSVGGDPQEAPELVDPQAFPVPKITKPRADVKPFEYVEVGAKIPNYTKGEKWGTQAEPISKMQMPLPAAESLKHIVTPVGFEVQLFMCEEDYENGGKPIAMTWDERGRLWICETVDYPNELQPPGEGRDRIRICEDTNGDGRADKFTVFAEKLSIPTTLTFSRGGVIVQNASETLYLKDTTGDDVADEHTVLFSGWGVNDTHGGVSNFQYGHDNWIWGMQGYNESRPTGPHLKSQPQTFRQGFFRFKPDGSEIEFIRSTNNNTWGLGISEEGIIFGSTANHNPSVYMPIPNRYYEQVRGWSPEVLGTIADTHLFQPSTDKIRQMDHHGGYTAGLGHALYTARTYPKEYWNRVAFVCEPTGHLVGSFVLRKDGADFTSSSPFNLFASDDEWTSPIMAEVGPDGNVWVLDWYNFIIQHNPTPIGFTTGKGNAYETDLRDKRHGRVYRVVYTGESSQESGVKGQKGTVNADASAESFTLKNASPEKLVATLKHPNLLWRRHAQRLLVERGKADVVPELIKLIADESVDEIGLNVGVVHALWTIEGLGAVDPSSSPAFRAVAEALKHQSAAVRRNALEVIAREQVGCALSMHEDGLLNDEDAQVRLAAYLAYADSRAFGDSLHIASHFRNMPTFDRWTRDAATAAAANHSHSFLELAGSKNPPSEDYLDIVGRVAEHHARVADTEDIGDLLTTLPRKKPAILERILVGLNRGWPKDKSAKLEPSAEEALGELFKTSPNLRGPLATLAAKLGSKELEKFAVEISESYLAQINDDELDLAKRVDAAKQLVNFRKSDIKVLEELLGLLGPRTPPDLAAGLLAAVGQSEAPTGGEAIVEVIRTLTPQSRQEAIRLLLARTAWTPALLTALDSGSVQLTELTLDQKQALASHPDKKMAEAAKTLLARGGGLPNADRQKVLEEMLPITKITGDANAGKLVFEKQCSKCHMHSGKGTKIGPDLTGMAVHPKAELLVHLIDPSRSVEGNYRVYTAAMDDGRILTGLLASESKTAIEIVDAEAKRHTLLRDEIEELVGSPKSLMPEGFEKQVTKDDITNLLEFLTQRGQYTPVPLEKYATVVSTKGMFNSEEQEVERLIFQDWSPKVFQGVPFLLVDPRGDRVANAIMLKTDQGGIPPRMPASVTLPCNQPAKAIHFLSGVSGWGYPASEEGSETMIVRLKYADGSTEDHSLINGQHFADYIRRVDVPGSQFAFQLRGQQLRYLAVQPQKTEIIKEIELLKGKDRCVPVVMAVTIEGLESK
jgi:putative membrane-bound dehydrogenase-like protein